MRLSSLGFSLAELLVALAILGTMVPFTIPKVLQVQNQAHWNADPTWFNWGS